jgi:tryptophan 7-halogenase
MKISKIAIIGGGTAGWWAAGYLEKTFPELEITLIESDVIPKIGVGESTVPPIKSFFESMDISEKDWMDRCHAIYKYGNIKQGFKSIDDEEFPFTFWYNDDNVFDSWYSEYKSGNKNKLDINKDLYYKNDSRTYAYHLDAELAGSVVKENCKKVKHVILTITDRSQLPEADLYLDCTGFARKFIEDTTEIVYDHHLVDSAVVCPFELDEDVPPFTRSIARPYGWQFIIALQTRIGTGYVYASKYVSDEEAVEQFKEFNKHRKPFMNNHPRIIKWKPNVLKNPWSGKTVAIGSSSGFLDPLEATALFMLKIQITTLASCLEREISPKVYNRLMTQIWRENSIYTLHHYMLSKRQDTEFWKYYNKFDVKKSLWENYKSKQNSHTKLYPDSLWASLGLYYDEFTFYEPKS